MPTTPHADLCPTCGASSYVIRAEAGPERARVILTRRCESTECRAEWRVERSSVDGAFVERVLDEPGGLKP